jgi:hypothetical protein
MELNMCARSVVLGANPVCFDGPASYYPQPQPITSITNHIMSYIIQTYSNVVFFQGPIPYPIVDKDYSFMLVDYTFNFTSYFLVMDRHGTVDIEGHGSMIHNNLISTGTWEYMSSTRGSTTATSLRFFTERTSPVPDNLSVLPILLLTITLLSFFKRKLGSTI